MDKSRVETLVWVLIYGGLLTACVAVFMLRADNGGTSIVAWLMLAVGVLAAAAGAALVVVRARMQEPPIPQKGPRR